jgi:protein TonB
MRVVIFAIVVLLHVCFAYALLHGLGAKYLKVIVPPIVIQQIDQPMEREKPTVSPTKVSQISPYIPQPEYVDINAPVEPNAITVQSISAAPPAPTIVAGPVVRTGASVDPRNPLHIGEEYYPDASKRIGEEGVCRVQLRVRVDGIIVDPQIVQTSNFPRLDDACLKGVIGQRMLPATEDGKPVESVTVVRIHWKLRANR